MDWSKSKTWLILLFLCINIFLLGYLLNINISTSYIDKDTIEQTIAVLNRNDVSIDASLIPAKIPSIGTMEVTNALEDPRVLADFVLGRSYSVSDSGKIFSKGSKQLSVAGDMIYYIDDAPEEHLGGLAPETAEKIATQRLSSYGFDLSNAKTNVSPQEDGSFLVRVEQTLEAVTLFDSWFEIQVSPDGIRSFEGSWFIPSGKKDFFDRNATKVKLITSVLIDFLSDPTRPRQQTMSIVDISLGYTTGAKGTFHKEVTAMPVWRITTDDGRIYLYDARSE